MLLCSFVEEQKRLTLLIFLYFCGLDYRVLGDFFWIVDSNLKDQTFQTLITPSFSPYRKPTCFRFFPFSFIFLIITHWVLILPIRCWQINWGVLVRFLLLHSYFLKKIDLKKSMKQSRSSYQFWNQLMHVDCLGFLFSFTAWPSSLLSNSFVILVLHTWNSRKKMWLS